MFNVVQFRNWNTRRILQKVELQECQIRRRSATRQDLEVVCQGLRRRLVRIPWPSAMSRVGAAETCL